MELDKREMSRSNIGKKGNKKPRANLQAAKFADICLVNCINQHIDNVFRLQIHKYIKLYLNICVNINIYIYRWSMVKYAPVNTICSKAFETDLKCFEFGCSLTVQQSNLHKHQKAAPYLPWRYLAPASCTAKGERKKGVLEGNWIPSLTEFWHHLYKKMSTTSSLKEGMLLFFWPRPPQVHKLLLGQHQHPKPLP